MTLDEYLKLDPDDRTLASLKMDEFRLGDLLDDACKRLDEKSKRIAELEADIDYIALYASDDSPLPDDPDEALYQILKRCWASRRKTAEQAKEGDA